MEDEEKYLTKGAKEAAERVIKRRGGPHPALEYGVIRLSTRAHNQLIKQLREWDLYKARCRADAKNHVVI